MKECNSEQSIYQQWVSQLNRLQYSLDDFRSVDFNKFSLSEIDELKIKLQKISLKSSGLMTYLSSII